MRADFTSGKKKLITRSVINITLYCENIWYEKTRGDVAAALKFHAICFGGVNRQYTLSRMLLY